MLHTCLSLENYLCSHLGRFATSMIALVASNCKRRIFHLKRLLHMSELLASL